MAGICSSVGGGDLFDMPPSIICPVLFPSSLIATHTSTATVVVNNTIFTRRDRRGGRSRDRSPRLTAYKSTDRTSSLRYKIPCHYSDIV